jgi:hypothetical protein
MKRRSWPWVRIVVSMMSRTRESSRAAAEERRGWSSSPWDATISTVA